MQQQPQEVPVYIVQKCWFDGPQQPNDRSLDFRRIFTSCEIAEQVAIQSANAYNYKPDAPVSTILLNAHNSATSYAFATCGKLFWVRRAYAVNIVNNQLPAGAVCSITNGIVGGTGNPRSSRGNEQVRNCVVLVPDDTQQAQAAAEQLRQLNSSQNTLHPDTNFEPLKLQTDPVSDNVLQDWPDYTSWRSYTTNANAVTSGKRGDDSTNPTWGQAPTMMMTMAATDDEIAAPPAKKRAFRG